MMINGKNYVEEASKELYINVSRVRGIGVMHELFDEECNESDYNYHSTLWAEDLEDEDMIVDFTFDELKIGSKLIYTRLTSGESYGCDKIMLSLVR